MSVMKSEPVTCLQARIEKGASARLPTPHGEFTITSYFDLTTRIEHLAVHVGDLAAEAVLVRVHSECLTGDIFGSLRCDCGPQLQMALARIAQVGRGMVIYMRGHEGRGIGIDQKLRAYTLQDQGLDTVEANLALGHPADSRRFEAAAAILHDFGVRSVCLMSNNPLKLLALQQQGIRIEQREPHEIEANPENASYLATKRDRLGHLLAAESRTFSTESRTSE
jgi:GTP cyclohydrolase II